jgi:hypothetical protein
LELSLGFGNLASCNLQKLVGFFLMGVGASIMNISDCGFLIYNYPFCVHLFTDSRQFLGFCVSEMVIPNGYHFLFNLLFPSFILIKQFLGFCVSEMVIPNGYHFLFNLLFPSFILIKQFLGFCVSEMVIPNGYHLFNLLFQSFILV